LRRRAREAPVSAPETRALLDRLWEILAADGGVGLAAPQIGEASRAIVIRDPRRPAGQQRLDLVNPVIGRTFGPDEPFEEGCLSFPDLYTTVRRPQGIEVAYSVPESGDQRLQLRDNELLARIIQHEVDHLDGVLFIDHLTRWERWLLGPRLLWIMLRGVWGR
jgi:peptide deformylase